MRTSRSYHSCRIGGFTLIEVLAVIVVLSLIAGTAIVRLSSVNSAALIDSIASQIRDLDAKARLLSRTGEPCQLVLGDSPSLILNCGDSAEAVASVRWPQHLEVEIQTDSELNDVIEFDRLGRSVDYMVLLVTDAYVRAWRVSGLTGHVMVQEVAP